MANSRRLQGLIDAGFDLTTQHGAYLRPRCSQCEVLVISGVACHEAGCPNIGHNCPECGSLHRSMELAAQCCQPVDQEEQRDED